MLEIIVPAREAGELWDESNECFIAIPARKEQVLQLEHSLISLSKWESKWCKPFLTDKGKSIEETIDYIKCMTLNRNIPQDIYDDLSEDNFKTIHDYIYAPMTATTIYEEKSGGSRETITSELIYYWMIAQNIPLECDKWHLNRLMTLIRVCAVKNNPPKKRSTREIISHNAALNAARRKKLNTKG